MGYVIKSAIISEHIYDYEKDAKHGKYSNDHVSSFGGSGSGLVFHAAAAAYGEKKYVLSAL